MKKYMRIGYIFVVVLLTASVALAASSSSSSIAIASNGGTSIVTSSSQATGNGVAVSNSDSESDNGGTSMSESYSTAKDNEVVVSNSKAVSSTPNTVVKTTTVNGVTTATINGMPTPTKLINTPIVPNTPYHRNFFIYASDEIKRIESSSGIENINVLNNSNSTNDLKRIIVNGEPMYVHNDDNESGNSTNTTLINSTSNMLANLQISDTLITPNTTVNIPRRNTASNDTISAFNGTNMTYSISSDNSKDSPSLLKTFLDFLHI